MKTMKTFSRRIAALLLVVTVGITALAPAASASSIQLPSLPKDQCVVDDAGVLSDSTTSELETLNAQLSSSCDGAQIGVLTVDYTGSATTEDYATEAFNTWGIGSSSKNNGVLILLVMQSDQYADGDYYLTYGDGFRSTMLADQASTLVQTMEDDFAAKKYDAAVLTCATNVANTIAEVYGVTLSGGTIYSDGSDTQTTRPSVEPIPPQKHYSIWENFIGGIFSMLQNLSETVIVPIAAAILALVMCYELIDMIVEKNNMHDFDSSMFFRWIFKSAFAILIVTNTWNIVMGVFDATQQVVNQSAGVIIGDTSIDFDTLLPDLESRLEAMDIGPLLDLWFQTLVVGLTMNILSICIFLVTYGRMIEIYAVTALGPIPLATLGNAEWRGMGQNYLKSLLALGFQAFLIMVVVGIYAVLIQQIGTADDISGAIWGCMGYTVLLCFCLFKTGSISKAVFTAH